MNKFLEKYKWLYIWIFALLLIACGVFQVLKPEYITYVYGGALIFLSLTMIKPFIVLKKPLVKWITFSGMIIEVVSGVLFIIFKEKIDAIPTFSYCIGAMFYIHGLIHFFSVSMGFVKPQYAVFFSNMIILTAGAFVAFSKSDNSVLKYVNLGVLIALAIINVLVGIREFFYYILDNLQMTKDEYIEKKRQNRLAKKNANNKSRIDKKEQKEKEAMMENEALKFDPTVDRAFAEIDEKEEPIKKNFDFDDMQFTNDSEPTEEGLEPSSDDFSQETNEEASFNEGEVSQPLDDYSDNDYSANEENQEDDSPFNDEYENSDDDMVNLDDLPKHE